MGMDFDILELLRWHAVQAPLYVVWLAGIFWAVLTWKRHPRKSFLVMLVLAIILAESLVWPFAMQFLLHDIQGGGMGDIQDRWMLMEFCHSVVNAALWVVLLAALFVVDRRPPAPRGPDGELLPPELRAEPRS